MLPRLNPILAVAHRDLRAEFAGKRGRGWVLPIITTLLIVPAASMDANVWRPTRSTIRITGEVPPVVAELDEVEVVNDGADMGIFPDGDGTGLVTMGRLPPDAVRKALDHNGPSLQWVTTTRSHKMPGRTLLLGLIAASVLTGAVSESIAGERSRNTLQTLLTAAISRLEILLGKWAAWGGYGVLAACLGALAGMLFGTIDAGWWMIPLPLVPLSTVALGLFLVRRATDSVSGATISLRVLPAVLSVLGLFAWFLGNSNPFLGALVPIGGALVATGNTWPAAGPAVVATLVTGATTFGMLSWAARDLEQSPPRSNDTGSTLWRSCTLLLIALCLWWTPLLGPLLWAQAGNPRITDTLPVPFGVLAASLGLLLAAGVGVIRFGSSPRDLGLRLPRWSFPAPALAVLALCLIAQPLFDAGLFAQGSLGPPAARLLTGTHPVSMPILVAVGSILAQEIFFRGWAQTRIGPSLSTAAFVLVCTPFNPMWGAVVAIGMTAITRMSAGSILPAIGVRLSALALLPLMPAIPSGVALAVCIPCTLALLLWALRMPTAKPETTK